MASVGTASSFSDDWSRPDRPTSVEFQIVQHGGHSSAVELLPCRLQWSKQEPHTGKDRFMRAVYEASYLRAENAYYRKVRRSSILLQAEIETVLLAYSAVQELRACLHRLDELTVKSERQSASLRQSVLGTMWSRNASLLRTAIDDYRVMIDRIDASFTKLQESQQDFTAALRRIDQEYADFFTVQLGEEAVKF
ncbi:hypothetical protein BDV38DRAFT_275123 [Aspergillus pseudotamarii]|uniref:Uncharacterized protein n=1 Tax=Aspergillus pseudotamarii TaxID=132259 RepID=A0A5N6SH57_ASPPS|nr:uncharacterized protein BDV38DRAFT_275123 [Aspergillus pseudotamarii]KAE8132444.1 hypothetical protein BDV38DRAFT_275123 [Aspergillus pseudotamarii]